MFADSKECVTNYIIYVQGCWLVRHHVTTCIDGQIDIQAYRHIERDGGRGERERERERERQTDRQTDRQTETETDRQTDTHTHTHTHTHTQK